MSRTLLRTLAHRTAGVCTIPLVLSLVLALALLSGCGGGSIAGIDDAVRERPLGAVRSVQRLNRVEYDNTIRDLTGSELKPGALFPPDDISHGFDNIADVLSLSPVQVEMAYNAAVAVVDDVMARDKVRHLRYEAETIGAANGTVAGDAWKLVSEGEIVVAADPIEGHDGQGRYTIAALVHAERTGPTPVRIVIRVDGRDVESFDILDGATKRAYRTEVELPRAPATIALAYTNDLETGSRYRNVHVDAITIDGPAGVVVENPLRATLVACNLDTDDCLRETIARFGDRAWRRPLRRAEIDDLVTLAAEVEADELTHTDDVGTARDAGLATALRAILASPHFLFRIERADPTTNTASLDAYALASRLSYFLWSTQPDEALYERAASGALIEDSVLALEIERMLDDRRATAFVDNFVGQWLSLRGLDEHEPDARAFPDYDVALKNDMVTETKLVFAELLRHNRPVHELLTADFTYTNPRLSRHYGLADRGAADFARRSLPGERTGILGHASVLTATSHPARTSPVKRGKWVLEQLLCTIPPPPPPGVDGLPQEEKPSGSLRERMEAHRAEPVCAGCHSFMDPIGFGLENFDATGRFRIDDAGFAIDASGTLPSGDEFEGGVELASLIATDKRFPRCVTTKLATYALGHAPTWDVRPLTERWLVEGAGLRDLVRSLIMSEPFRTHRTRTTPR